MTSHNNNASFNDTVPVFPMWEQLEAPGCQLGESFFREHRCQLSSSVPLVGVPKPSAELYKKSVRENAIFVESCIRPLLSRLAKPSLSVGIRNTMMDFFERDAFIFSSMGVCRVCMQIIEATLKEIKKGQERVVEYVLLGLDLLLNDNIFRQMDEDLQKISLLSQYRDLTLSSAVKILSVIWSRSFHQLDVMEKRALLSTNISESAPNLSDLTKKINVSGDSYNTNFSVSQYYTQCLSDNFEALYVKGEPVLEKVYQLFSGSLCLWHKYHFLKIVSSSSFSQWAVSQVGYLEKFEVTRHSVEIALASVDVAGTNIGSSRSAVTGPPTAIMIDERVGYYVDNMILADNPPGFILKLNDNHKHQLVYIIRQLRDKAMPVDMVESLMALVSQEYFQAVSDKVKRIVFEIVELIVLEVETVTQCEVAVSNLICFLNHPALEDLTKVQMEWLLDNIVRLKVDFSESSQSGALLEFLRDFPTLSKGSELSALCFYLGCLGVRAAN